LGALIAAAIIILNSKDKDKIIKKVKTKFDSVFSEDEIKKKINVIIPQDIIPPVLKPTAHQPAKLFKKK
jgi:predicted AlkP superfamily phosphohydrolase/phosphomutase